MLYCCTVLLFHVSVVLLYRCCTVALFCTWVTSTAPQDFPFTDVGLHEVLALSSTHHRSTCIRRCETSSLNAASPTDLEKIGVVYSRRFLPGSFLDTTGQSQLLLPAEVEKGLWWGPLHPFETSPAALSLSSNSFSNSNIQYSILFELGDLNRNSCLWC